MNELYQLFLEHPSVTTDSRQVAPGQIFFALKGERFDGNEYASEVLQKGAALAVVDDPHVIETPDGKRPHKGLNGKYYLVDDVLTTLQKLAAHHRRQFRHWHKPVTVIGITGTNGKTTTKELLNAVLSRKYNVLATAGNLNNQIGVPLTLLKVTPEHEMAIIEMGANHPMDIADLCSIVHPDYGLITNVGKAHLLGFGSLEGVIEAKTKLYQSIAKDKGIIFIDSFNNQLLMKAMVIGVQCRPYLPAEVVACDPKLTVCMYDTEADDPVEIHTHLIGSYNALNCQAAATVGRYFGVSLADVKSALESYEPQNMRSQLIDMGHDNCLIMDAYNANVSSMTAALDSLAANPAQHKSVILGDMLELGAESAKEHNAIIDRLLSGHIKLDAIILVGSEFDQAVASRGPLSTTAQLRCYKSADDLCSDNTLLSNLGGTILIKGSRGIHLEKVRDAILSTHQ